MVSVVCHVVVISIFIMSCGKFYEKFEKIARLFDNYGVQMGAGTSARDGENIFTRHLMVHGMPFSLVQSGQWGDKVVFVLEARRREGVDKLLIVRVLPESYVLI